VTDATGEPDIPESAPSTAEGVAPPVIHGGDSPRPATPTLPSPNAAGRYTARFAITYLFLGVVLAGAVAGLVVLLVKPGGGGSGGSAWSPWKPASGTTAAMTSQIADHVAPEYKLNKAGAELVAVVPSPPQVTSGTHKIVISHVAIRKAAKSKSNIQVFTSGATWLDQFCGLGNGCSIASGQASETRGRLVRREALEVALYTFKYVPAINSVIAFMPPPPGQTTATLLYLQKANYAKELSQPLSKTLPLAKPPLPTQADNAEAATIDKLTLPAIYNYSYQPLQDNSALLVLDPISS
jgi:hypothetical protein